MDKRIIDFIKKHHVLTLATSKGNEPWVASCFYAYLAEINLFVFTSDRSTRHIKDIEANSKVAASIVLETRIVGKIQGVQLKGRVTEPKEEQKKKARAAYLKRFPYAVLKDSILWILEPDYIKMTDNRLGFGKKLIWEIEESMNQEQ